MSELFENKYEIHHLFVPYSEISKDFWLTEDILLKQHKNRLMCFTLSKGKQELFPQETILPFLKISSLFGNTTPILTGGGGNSLKSKKDFGKNPDSLSIGDLRINYDVKNKKIFSKDIPKHLKNIKKITLEFNNVLSHCVFLRRSLDYYYDAGVDSIYSDNGFVSSIMSLESLFNENPQDIAYKLRARLSFLLGITKFSSEDVFKNMQELYKIRNSIVHGMEVKSNTNEMRGNASKYSTEAIKIMMVLSKNRLGGFLKEKLKSDSMKKRLLQEIDEAMIDSKKSKVLSKEISSNMKKMRFPFMDKYKDTTWMIAKPRDAIR